MAGSSWLWPLPLVAGLANLVVTGAGVAVVVRLDPCEGGPGCGSYGIMMALFIPVVVGSLGAAAAFAATGLVWRKGRHAVEPESEMLAEGSGVGCGDAVMSEMLGNGVPTRLGSERAISPVVVGDLDGMGPLIGTPRMPRCRE